MKCPRLTLNTVCLSGLACIRRSFTKDPGMVLIPEVDTEVLTCQQNIWNFRRKRYCLNFYVVEAHRGG